MSHKDVTDVRPSFSSEEKGGDTHIVVEAGTEIELERRFGFFSCLGLAFALLNSWTGESGGEFITNPQPCTSQITPNTPLLTLSFPISRSAS